MTSAPPGGGCDQAVYAYAREDLDGWKAELGRRLENGVFGENLTTSGLNVNGALIGERWRIGPDVVLEVSCPRIPCVTFQGWLERDGWPPTRFRRRARNWPRRRYQARDGTPARRI